jgi:hypothetical protein
MRMPAFGSVIAALGGKRTLDKCNDDRDGYGEDGDSERRRDNPSLRRSKAVLNAVIDLLKAR